MAGQQELHIFLPHWPPNGRDAYTYTPYLSEQVITSVDKGSSHMLLQNRLVSRRLNDFPAGL